MSQAYHAERMARMGLAVPEVDHHAAVGQRVELRVDDAGNAPADDAPPRCMLRQRIAVAGAVHTVRVDFDPRPQTGQVTLALMLLCDGQWIEQATSTHDADDDHNAADGDANPAALTVRFLQFDAVANDMVPRFVADGRYRVDVRCSAPLVVPFGFATAG